MQDVKRFKHAGFTIRIVPDEDAESPREWDNLGTMVLFHRRRSLGDSVKTDRGDIRCGFEPETLKAHVARPDVIALPVYGYDHGDITVRTTPYGCPWDSGQLGFIFVDRAKVLAEYKAKRVTAKLRAKVEDVLRSEVAVYDRWLTGGFTGFVVENVDGEHLDSCWGFDDPDYCETQAREAAEARAKSAASARELCAE